MPSTFLSPLPALINEGDEGTPSTAAVRIASPRRLEGRAGK